MGALKQMPDEMKRLRARVAELEAILKCVRCGHLRSEHDEDDAPCFGGRAKDAKPGEGEYCMCDGFESEHVPRSPSTPTR